MTEKDKGKDIFSLLEDETEKSKPKGNIFDMVAQSEKKHQKRIGVAKDTKEKPVYSPHPGDKVVIGKDGEVEKPIVEALAPLDKLRMQTRKADAEREKDEEFNKLKSDYLQVSKEKLMGANILISDIKKTVVKEMRAITTENFDYREANSTELDIKRNAFDRKQKEKIEEIERNVMFNWIEKDILGHYVRQYETVSALTPENTEIVRGIKFTEKDVIYTTDNGTYTFDGRETSNFGGFIATEMNILTERLSLEKAIKLMNGKTEETKKKGFAYAWLLIQPFLAQADNGKMLAIPMDYLKSTLTYMIKSQVHREEVKAIHEKRFQSKEDKEIQKKNVLETPREIVEKMNRRDIPKANALITFPYNFLAEEGVDFEMEVYEGEEIVISNEITNKSDFIKWNTAKSEIKFEGFRSRVSEVRNDLLTSINNSTIDHALYTSIVELSNVDRMRSIMHDKDWDSAVKFQEFSKPRLLNFAISKKLEEQEESTSISDIHIERNILAEETDKTEKIVKSEAEEAKEEETLEDTMDIVNDMIYGHLKDEPETSSKPKAKSKASNKVNKEFNNAVESFHNFIALLSFESERVSEVLLDTKSYIELDRSITPDMEMLKSVIESIKVPKYPSPEFEQLNVLFMIEKQYATLADIVNWGDDGIEITDTDEYKEAEHDLLQIIKPFEVERDKALELIESKIKEYIDGRKEYTDLKSITGRINKPELAKLKAVINLEDYPIDITHLLLEGIFDRHPELNQQLEVSSMYELPIKTGTLDTYLIVREMVVHFQGKEDVSWVDNLKVIIPTNVRRASHIRNTPHLQSMVSNPYLIQPLKRINDLAKIRNVGTTAQDIRPLTNEEITFNNMMAELFTDYKGLISVIDYEKLMNYIVECDGKSIEGYRLVKFIPAPTLVNKYFEIPTSTIIYPELNLVSLIEEVTKQPPTYVGLNDILLRANSIAYDKKDVLVENLSEIIEHRDSINKMDINPLTGLREIDKSDAKHDRAIAKYAPLLNKLKGTSHSITGKHPIESRKEVVHIIENPSSYPDLNQADLREAKIALDKIDAEVDKYDKQGDLERQKRKEELMRLAAEQKVKIEELNGRLAETVGPVIGEVVDTTLGFYNPERAQASLVNLFTQVGFMDFSKGKALLNFIITYVQDEPGVIQGSIYRIVEEFLEYITKETRDRDVDSPAERIKTVEGHFKTITSVLGLQSVLVIDMRDRVTLENTYKEVEGVKLSDKDIEDIAMFFQEFQYATPEVMEEAMRVFPKKELVDSATYDSVMGGNITELEEAYEGWYSRDFSLSENLKIMLELGKTENDFLDKHRNDDKLMEIVEHTTISEQYINDLKKSLE